MYMYECIHVLVYIHMYKHLYTCVYMQIHTLPHTYPSRALTCTCPCTNVRKQHCIHTHARAHTVLHAYNTQTYPHSNTHACTQHCIHKHKNTHIHTQMHVFVCIRTLHKHTCLHKHKRTHNILCMRVYSTAYIHVRLCIQYCRHTIDKQTHTRLYRFSCTQTPTPPYLFACTPHRPTNLRA